MRICYLKSGHYCSALQSLSLVSHDVIIKKIIPPNKIPEIILSGRLHGISRLDIGITTKNHIANPIILTILKLLLISQLHLEQLNPSLILMGEIRLRQLGHFIENINNLF